MPPKVLPTYEAFEIFSKKLTELGFRKITRQEFREKFTKLYLTAPRPRPGQETGFVFFPPDARNNYAVFVWTTWLEREGRAREEDAGWVLIAEDNTSLYFSHPMHRTRGFLRRLFKQAWIAWWRVLHRPVCTVCNSYMEITRGQGMKSRYWICRRRKDHESRETVRLDWDHGLPPKVRAYVESLRESRETHIVKRRREGKPTHVAMTTRKRWIVTHATGGKP